MSLLRRLVLAWFVLSLGVAAASPLVHPVNFEMICSGTSVKFIAQVDGEAVEMTSMSMDCPMCFTALPPPPQPALVFVTMHPPLAYATRSIPAARIAAATAAPLPARGPPAIA